MNNPSGSTSIGVTLDQISLLEGDVNPSGLITTAVSSNFSVPLSTNPYSLNSNGVTIEALVSTTTAIVGAAQPGVFFGLDNAGETYLTGLYLTSAGTLHGFAGGDGLGAASIAFPIDGTPHHLAMTWDASGNVVVYQDGVAVISVNVPNSPSASPSTPSSLEAWVEVSSSRAPRTGLTSSQSRERCSPWLRSGSTRLWLRRGTSSSSLSSASQPC